MTLRRGGAMAPLEVRMWSKVDVGRHHWTWRGAVNDSGYGAIWDGTRLVYAHRLAYELLVGPIPSGMTIDHTCANRLCVNPAHLEAVTIRENIRRAWKRKRDAA